MEPPFEKFKLEIVRFNEHLDYIERQSQNMDSSNPSFDYYKTTPRKQIEYSSMIITLYGYVEFYIEKFIFYHIYRYEQDFELYDNICDEIKKSHFNNSIELIKKIIDKKHRKYESADEKKVLLNLNNCISGVPNYKINMEAFTLHSGNLKHQWICNLFKNLGISLDVKLNMIENATSSNLYIKLDDLVDRRNDVAHGNINDILNVSAIRPYVEFIESYFSKINNVLNEKFNSDYYELIAQSSPKIEDPVIYSNTLLGITCGRKWGITNNDIILIKDSNGNLNISEITEVRAHGEDISVKLKTKIKENQSFYLFNKKGRFNNEDNYNNQNIFSYSEIRRMRHRLNKRIKSLLK